MRNLTFSFSSASKILALAVAASLCATPSQANSHDTAPQSYAGTASTFDGGGNVADYLGQVDQVNANGASQEISGICASACTMKLGERGICIHKDAQLWFHAARNPDGSFNAVATRMMLDAYPARIRVWAVNNHALISNEMTTMSGAQAISNGVIRCVT